MDITMRKVLAAALALSPMMLHAQAASPAPTRTAVAALVQPKELGAVKADSATVPASQPLRISTGVTPPKLISTVSIIDNQNLPLNLKVLDQLAIVSMTVNADGKPSDLKIVKSVGATMDANVLAAVSQYRFAPGTLDKQPTAVPLTLEITLRHSGL
jgi:TonB family protein